MRHPHDRSAEGSLGGTDNSIRLIQCQLSPSYTWLIGQHALLDAVRTQSTQLDELPGTLTNEVFDWTDAPYARLYSDILVPLRSFVF